MDGLGALIISPTRELAYQTFEVLRKVGKNHDFSAGLVIGGKVCIFFQHSLCLSDVLVVSSHKTDLVCAWFQDLKDESMKIHRTNIIICTPGRLLQHMDENSCFHASNLHMLGKVLMTHWITLSYSVRQCYIGRCGNCYKFFSWMLLLLVPILTFTGKFYSHNTNTISLVQ